VAGVDTDWQSSERGCVSYSCDECNSNPLASGPFSMVPS